MHPDRFATRTSARPDPPGGLGLRRVNAALRTEALRQLRRQQRSWTIGDRVTARATAITVRPGSSGTVVGFSGEGGHPLVDFDGLGRVLIRADHLRPEHWEGDDDAPAEARSSGRRRSSGTTRLSATPRPPAVAAAPAPPPPDWFDRQPPPLR
jgi:hypothetical protein